MSFSMDTPFSTNVPPGVGAEAVIRQMDDAELSCLGRNTYRFVSAMLRDPQQRAAIDRKVEELRKKGFFDAHPPKDPVYESELI